MVRADRVTEHDDVASRVVESNARSVFNFPRTP
jgi:hypothetical protein